MVESGEVQGVTEVAYCGLVIAGVGRDRGFDEGGVGALFVGCVYRKFRVM